MGKHVEKNHEVFVCCGQEHTFKGSILPGFSSHEECICPSCKAVLGKMRADNSFEPTVTSRPISVGTS